MPKKAVAPIKTSIPEVVLPETALTMLSKASDPIVALGNKFAERVAEDAKEITVDSPQSREFAILLVRDIESQSDAFEKSRFAETRPYDELKKRAIERYRPFVDGTRAGARIIRDKIAAYDAEIKRKAEEERAEQERAEAAERARLQAEQDRLAERARKAAKAGDDKKAAALLAQADDVGDKIADVSLRPAPTSYSIPKVDGTSERETWKFDTPINLRALVLACAEELKAGEDRLLQFIAANEVEIGKVVRALRSNHRIPGVVAKRVDTLAIRK